MNAFQERTKSLRLVKHSNKHVTPWFLYFRCFMAIISFPIHILFLLKQHIYDWLHAEPFFFKMTTADPVRLVSQSGRTNGTDTGRLEIFINGEWGTVCSFSPLKKSEADIACRQLGFSMGSISSTIVDDFEWVINASGMLVVSLTWSSLSPSRPLSHAHTMQFQLLIMSLICAYCMSCCELSVLALHMHKDTLPLPDFPGPLMPYGWVNWTAPQQVVMLIWGHVCMEEGMKLVLSVLTEMMWYSLA